jgi:AcrR family transcriptional regulator
VVVKASDRRSSLVKAAVEVIAAHGVEGATTRRIAAAAGASLASLHYVFESKEALFFAIWENQVDALEQSTRAGARRDGLAQTASRLLRETFDWFRSDEPYARVQLELTFWALRQDGSLGVRTYDLHTRVMRQGLTDGLLPGEDASVIDGLARLIVALADGISVQWMCYRDEGRLAEDLDNAQAALAGFLHSAGARAL